MRLIKLAVLSIVFLLIVVTLIGLLFPSEVRVSKAIDMEHPKEEVIKLLTDTAAWRKWHPSFVSGSVYQSQQPAGYKLRTKSDTLVVIDVEFERHKLAYGWQFHEYEGSDRYTLQWWADFSPGWYPWERFGSLFYEKTYGNMMELGLKKLDSVLIAQKIDTQPPPIHHPGW